MNSLIDKIDKYSKDDIVEKIQNSDVVAELVYRYATDQAAFLFDFDRTLHRDQDGVHIGWREQNEPLQDLLKNLSDKTGGAVAGISGRPEAFFLSRLPKLFEFNMPIGVEFGALILQGNSNETVLKHEISRKTISEVQKFTQECIDQVNAEFSVEKKEPVSMEGHKKTCCTILYNLVDHEGVTQSAGASLADLLKDKVAEFNVGRQENEVKFRIQQNSIQVDILPVYPDEAPVEGIGVDNGKYAATQYVVNNVAAFSGIESGTKKIYAWGDSSGDLPMFKAIKEFGGDNIIVTDGFPSEHMNLVDYHNGEYQDNLSFLKFLIDTPKHELKLLVERHNFQMSQKFFAGNSGSFNQVTLDFIP